MTYQGANNDAETQSQMIEAAIATNPDGIAISLADPEGLSAAAQAVTDAGIPLYTINSGVNNYKELGGITHIGQTETIAGNGAGERFNEAGVTKILCGRQEQTNVALEERCDGLAETFDGEVHLGVRRAGCRSRGPGAADRCPAAGRPGHRRLHGHRPQPAAAGHRRRSDRRP